MSDPAVEAAQRAMDLELSEGAGWSDIDFGAAAAREVLKPIREKCDEIRGAASGARRNPSDPDYDIGDAFDDGVLSLIDELAPLIYTTEGLAGE